MVVSKEYVGYLARQVAKKLTEREFLESSNQNALVEKLNQVMLDELQVEDRINDEVRQILEVIQEDMRKEGANYQEMFKKVKVQLVQRYKAVL
jgi:hypothetical protein